MLDFALTALASLLFVVNPPGAVPTYLLMSQGDDPAKRRQTAWRASLVTALTLAVFAAAGNAGDLTCYTLHDNLREPRLL